MRRFLADMSVTDLQRFLHASTISVLFAIPFYIVRFTAQHFWIIGKTYFRTLSSNDQVFGLGLHIFLLQTAARGK